MAFCSYCGSKVADGARFCESCGAPMQTQPQQPTQPVYQPQPQSQQPVYQPRPQQAAPKKKKGGCLSFLLSAVIFFVVVLAITGIGELWDNATKDFSCQELNMEIPVFLKDVSKEKKFSDYTFVLDSTKMCVFGLRESIDDLGDMTLGEYTELVIRVNGFTSLASSYNDYYRFTFTADDSDGEPTRFVVYTFKSDDAYWMLQFAGPKDGYFGEIADSVEFD